MIQKVSQICQMNFKISIDKFAKLYYNIDTIENKLNIKNPIGGSSNETLSCYNK